MISKKKEIPVDGRGKLFTGLDLEWTKNYKIRNGNKPFCFSYVYFSPPRDINHIEEKLEVGFVLKYIESEEEIQLLIEQADFILEEYLSSSDVIVGHQLSSDISVVINYGGTESTKNFLTLKNLWHSRKVYCDDSMTTVFDTRYDLDPILNLKSRRLVDVCEECLLDVKQPELNGSMTKMQTGFLYSKKLEVMEKLSVLNIRHSLSAVLLFHLFNEGIRPKNYINVNRILYNNLRSCFHYISSDEFRNLIVSAK